MEAALPLTVPYTWPTVAIVNDKSSGVADADVDVMVHAIADDILRTFGPIWHIGAHFEFVPTGKKPPADAWVVALLSTSDQAGALGYHDLTPAGLPLGKIFAATDRQYGQNVGVTLDHEVKEMLADPWIDLAAQSDDGKFYGWENCDAVEADALGYPGFKGFTHSAFVTPAWFGHGAGAVSYPQGRVTLPFELAPGGYISVFDPASGQGWTQVTAQKVTSDLDQALAVPRVGSRRERRFRGRGNWVLSSFEMG